MLNKIKSSMSKKNPTKKATNESDNKAKESYFERSKSWADEIFTNAEVAKRQWFFAFSVSSIINILLLLTIVLMMPLKTTQLGLVHTRDDGSWDYVTIHDEKEITQNWNQTRADIARYINIREGYEPHNVTADNAFVKLLSNKIVYQEYIDEQSDDDSLLNTIGKSGYAKVERINISRLSEKNDSDVNETINQAIVSFNVIVNTAKRARTLHFTANVGWDYIEQTNKSKEVLLNNPFGFKVTNFQITNME